MRKSIRLILFVLAALVFCTGFTYAASKPITITLDGNKIETDTDPVIQSGRTLVPVAVIVKNMGGESVWNGKTKEVTITYEGTVITLKIDSKDAYIDGNKTTLDVPATIINNRTIVPLSFISKAMKYNVAYDSVNHIAVITSPASPKQRVEEVNLLAEENGCRVEVKGIEPFTGYTTMTLTEPDRFVLDMKKTALAAQSVGNTAENTVVSSVRMSQFTAEDARIVVDLKEKTAPKVSLSDDKKSLYLDFNAVNTASLPSEPNRGGDRDTDDEYVNDDRDNNPVTLPFDGEFLVVIDPGHGGSDPGALGKEGSKTVLQEKDLNLPIALRVRDLLESAGISTYMTRETDKGVILASRPAIANEMNAGLFVSIHNNSTTSANVNGTEVLYYNKATDDQYGIGTSKEIATVVGNYMKQAMGSLGISFNKYSDRPGLAVLNKTSMPAIVVEGAYLSNASDRNIMKTDAYIEQYAQAVAGAIIEVVNNRR